MKKRLLILSCSQHKRPNPGLLPAVERYDGSQFRVLKKFLREDPGGELSIYILSAKFGLISAAKPIPWYNHKMTLSRANELRPQVLEKFSDILQVKSPNDLFISLGKVYWQALPGYESLLPPDLKKTIPEGSQGHRQSELRTWLYDGLAASTDSQNLTMSTKQDKVRLRGVEINLTTEEIIDLARQKLAEGQDKAASYQSWYVPIGDDRVAPKWLISQLTGLPVGAFHTGDARRVLRQLGIEVRRI